MISCYDDVFVEDGVVLWLVCVGLLFDVLYVLFELCLIELIVEFILLVVFMGMYVLLCFELGVIFLLCWDFFGIVLGDIVCIEKWFFVGDVLCCVVCVCGWLYLCVFG